MLVLTRRPQETILIGDNITVTVLSAYGGKVKIGVTAPKDMVVDRDEVRDRRNANWPARENASGNAADA